MADYPLINGFAYSWASCKFKIDGADAIYIKEISYTHTVERAKMRGAGMRPLGETRGEYEAEGSVTLTREGWDQLRAKLGNGYMEKRFSISTSYAEEGQQTVTDELLDCKINSVENSPSQGTDGLEVSLELSVMSIREGGLNPLNATR